MAGLMPQPWKHPKLGTYYYRKIVPPHLRGPLGWLLNKPNGTLTELRLPLSTSNAQQAKLLYPEKAAEADALLTRAAGGAVRLTHQQVVALAGTWYAKELARLEAEPGDPDDWDIMLGVLSDAADEGEGFRRGTVAKQVAGDVNSLLASERLEVDSATRAMIEERVFWLSVELYQTLKRRADGDYTPDPKLQTFPEWRGPDEAPKASPAAAVAVSDLFNGWAQERRFAPKTRDMWEKIIGKLTAHVGHEDAARITDTDIIAWKDAMVATGLAPKTISNNLTAAKTFFRWASRNKKIATDPAATVEYKAKRKPGERKQSYSDEDAKRILPATRKETDPLKRWAPWLCAFSGARIDEIAGAMVADVQKVGRIDFIRIDPVNREKGASVKNEASIRSVPLHPAVIRQGFLKYVATLPKDGPLFPGIKPDRYGKRGSMDRRPSRVGSGTA